MTVRVYPTCCTSAYCGNDPESCPTCPNWPVLAKFKQWVDVAGAKQADPIWSPLVYRATLGEPCHD